MAVTFTPNVALAKPDNTELGKDWVIEAPNLQDDNNQILIAQTNYPVATYTPVIKGSTSDPAIGSGGRIVGEYQNLQGFIMGSWIIEFVDPGVAAGSGAYAISLPFPADGSFHTAGGSFAGNPGANSIIGEGYIQDTSTVSTSGFIACDLVTVSGVSYIRLLTEFFTAPAKTSPFMTNTMPFTIVTTDCFSGSFFYKKA